MAYNEFAYFYDELNAAADYDALYRYVSTELTARGAKPGDGGLLADFGCGTGELTLMLAQAGYDVIGIDQSEEMLSILRDKADELGLAGRVLLLQQDLLQLDLYGTIKAAVSTFDTFNHIGPVDRFERAIAKAAFFMEKTASLSLISIRRTSMPRCSAAKPSTLMPKTLSAAGATAMTPLPAGWTSRSRSGIKRQAMSFRKAFLNTAMRWIPCVPCWTATVLRSCGWPTVKPSANRAPTASAGSSPSSSGTPRRNKPHVKYR